MARIIYLSNDEEKALRLLAEGKNAHQIKAQCDIPLAGMAAFTSQIRRKTGIRDTRFPIECRRYIEQFEQAIVGTLSEAQERVLRFVVKGGAFESLAEQMGLDKVEVWKLYDEGCKAAGIFTRDEQTRRVQLRLYLATFCPSELHELKPPSEIELQFLRMFADGKTYDEISREINQRVHYVQWKIKDVCQRLGLTARGRNTQRRLARAYLEHQERHAEAQAAHEPVTMDDPAFN